MGYYYFFYSSLPPISLDQDLPISTEEFRWMLELNLTNTDLSKLKLLREWIDLENFRSLWLNQFIDPNGNLDEKELEEAFLSLDLPDYVVDFLSQYESTEDRLRNFSFLWIKFFEKADAFFQGFLKKYFQFERELRLVLTALRCKYAHRDLIKEIQFEDPQDPFFAHLLTQKDMEDIQPELDYLPVKEIFISNISDPAALHVKLLQFKFMKIEKMVDDDPFAIDQILGYYIRLILLERFHQLKKQDGKSSLQEMIRE